MSVLPRFSRPVFNREPQDSTTKYHSLSQTFQHTHSAIERSFHYSTNAELWARSVLRLSTQATASPTPPPGFLTTSSLTRVPKVPKKKAGKHGPFVFDVVIYKTKARPVLDATALRAQIHCKFAALFVTRQHR